jgi:hypothetical protein
MEHQWYDNRQGRTEVYEVLSKIFRTGAAIYTSVVVARSTGTKRPNCEFRVVLRSFAATAWKSAKTSLRTSARTGLAASPRQCPIWHFRPHPAVFGEIQNGCYPHTPNSPDLAPCGFFLFPKIKLKLKGRRFDTIEEIQAESQIVLDTLKEKDFQEAFQKRRRRWDQFSASGRELLRGWWRPIGLMLSFMIFTVSVRNILDSP